MYASANNLKQKCVERARLAQRIMTNCATLHSIYMDNEEVY